MAGSKVALIVDAKSKTRLGWKINLYVLGKRVHIAYLSFRERFRLSPMLNGAIVTSTLIFARSCRV